MEYTLDLRLEDFQKCIYSDARFFVLPGGRRSGKTESAARWILTELFKKPDTSGLWVDTRQSNLDKYIDRYFQRLLRPIWHICKYNKQKKILTLPNRSYIDFASAERPENLEGFEYERAVINEAGIVLKSESLWYNTLLPMISREGAQTRVVGTPKGKNSLYENMWNMSQDDNYPDWKGVRIPSTKSKFVDDTMLRTWKDTMNEAVYQQEVLAIFTTKEGVVYPDFDEQMHVLDTDTFNYGILKEKYMGVDFGTTNPTAAVFVGVDFDNNFYVFDEYYKTDDTFKNHAQKILAKKWQRAKPTRSSTDYMGQWCDPSAKQAILEFGNYGLYLNPANNDVQVGINRISSLLKPQGATMKPRLYILSHCTNLIREFQMYEWEKNREGYNKKEAPKKENDHALDALRYVFNEFISFDKDGYFAL